MRRKLLKEESGQALIEAAIISTTLLVVTLGIIDFGRAIHDVETMETLAAGGSSAASRDQNGSAAGTAAQVNSRGGSSLKMSSNGCVIVTIVTNNSGTLAITDQAYNCALQVTSKIGCLPGVNGCQSANPTLPSAAQTAISSEPSGSTLAITEIFYGYSTITPITRLLGAGYLPSTLYTATYY